jgi:hypothetical protein
MDIISSIKVFPKIMLILLLVKSHNMTFHMVCLTLHNNITQLTYDEYKILETIAKHKHNKKTLSLFRKCRYITKTSKKIMNEQKKWEFTKFNFNSSNDLKYLSLFLKKITKIIKSYTETYFLSSICKPTKTNKHIMKNEMLSRLIFFSEIMGPVTSLYEIKRYKIADFQDWAYSKKVKYYVYVMTEFKSNVQYMIKTIKKYHNAKKNVTRTIGDKNKIISKMNKYLIRKVE